MGMGPKLLGWSKGDTLYALRLLPIGGYVRMAGMDPEEGKDELAPAHDPGSFMNKTVLQRMAIIFAGPFMNFILAMVLFVIVFTAIGVPTDSTNNQIGSVIAGGAAAKAGIVAGDQIVAINGQQTPTWADLTQIIHNSSDKQLLLTVRHDAKLKELKVTPKLDPQYKQGMIGIANSVTFMKKGTLDAAGFGLQRTWDFTKFIVVSLFEMITGKMKAEVGGPVAIVSAIGQGAAQGFANLLGLTGMLSIQLGLLNLFPIPALDGSRLAFLALEGVRGKPVDPNKENVIHLIGFALLILLMIFITYNDVTRLIVGKAG